jgi:hypothetical protein
MMFVSYNWVDVLHKSGNLTNIDCLLFCLYRIKRISVLVLIHRLQLIVRASIIAHKLVMMHDMMSNWFKNVNNSLNSFKILSNETKTFCDGFRLSFELAQFSVHLRAESFVKLVQDLMPLQESCMKKVRNSA